MHKFLDQQQLRDLTGTDVSKPSAKPSAVLAFEIKRICLLSREGIYEHWLHELLLRRPSVNASIEHIDEVKT